MPAGSPIDYAGEHVRGATARGQFDCGGTGREACPPSGCHSPVCPNKAPNLAQARRSWTVRAGNDLFRINLYADGTYGLDKRIPGPRGRGGSGVAWRRVARGVQS